MGEEGVVALDRHHRLPRLDRVAVAEGGDDQGVPVVEQSLRIAMASSMPPSIAFALEHLHQDLGVAAVGQQGGAGVVEVRVRVVALAHLLDRDSKTLGSSLSSRAVRDATITRPLRRRGRLRALPPRPRAEPQEGSAVDTRVATGARGRQLRRAPAWRPDGAGRRPIQAKTSNGGPDGADDRTDERPRRGPHGRARSGCPAPQVRALPATRSVLFLLVSRRGPTR